MRHIDALVQYLATTGWEARMGRLAEDRGMALDIQTFLSKFMSLDDSTGKTPQPRNSGGTETGQVKVKHVRFKKIPDCAPAPGAAQTNPKTVITRKAFPSGATDTTKTIWVPWPHSSRPQSPADWHGILPLLHHEVNQALIAYLRPLRTMEQHIRPSTAEKTWFRNNVYAVFDIAAKLSLLTSYNRTLFTRKIRPLICAKKRRYGRRGKKGRQKGAPLEPALSSARILHHFATVETSTTSSSSARTENNNNNGGWTIPLDQLLYHLGVIQHGQSVLATNAARITSTVTEMRRLIGVVAARLRALKPSPYPIAFEQQQQQQQQRQ
ncbi:hypothetical protein VTK26DRAFT_3756 [Humicola hyalothermophila]